jgi:hypothetical protein
LLFKYNRTRVYHYEKAIEEIDENIIKAFYEGIINNKYPKNDSLNYTINNSFGMSIEKIIGKADEISNIENKLNSIASNKKMELDISKNQIEYSINATYRKNNLTKDNSTSFEVINPSHFTSKLSIHVENNLNILGTSKREHKNIIILDNKQQNDFCSLNNCFLF